MYVEDARLIINCVCLLFCSASVITKRPPVLEQQATDALTGLLISSPTKKQRVTEGFQASTTLAGYSPELSKALRSVVKIFTTMARCGRVSQEWSCVLCAALSQAFRQLYPSPDPSQSYPVAGHTGMSVFQAALHHPTAIMRYCLQQCLPGTY